MGIFIVLFAYLLLVRLFSTNRSNERSRRRTAIFCGLGLWVVLALRSPFCGHDLLGGEMEGYSYYNMFHMMASTSWSSLFDSFYDKSSIESGWLLYCKIIILFTDYFQIFLAITAALQIIMIGYVIYKLSDDIVISFITYFAFGLYVMSFSGLRQSMAYAMTFLASYFLLKKKNAPFFLLVIMAYFIHRSAIVFILMFFLGKIKLTRQRLNLAVVVSLLTIPFFSLLSSYITAFVFPEKYAQHVVEESGAIGLFLLYLFLFFLSQKIPTGNQKMDFIREMILLAVLGQSLGIFDAGYSTRIAFYFSIFFTLYFPILINHYSDFKPKREITISVSVGLFAFFCWYVRGGYLNVVPYYFFWDNGLLYVK